MDICTAVYRTRRDYAKILSLDKLVNESHRYNLREKLLIRSVISKIENEEDDEHMLPVQNNNPNQQVMKNADTYTLESDDPTGHQDIRPKKKLKKDGDLPMDIAKQDLKSVMMS